MHFASVNGYSLINKCLEELYLATRTCNFINTTETSVFNLVLEGIFPFILSF